MNKTVNINVGGIVFHVEENAYNNLHADLTQLKAHFEGTASAQEIIADIESRIAEMFSEMLAKSNKEVITESEVDEVIAAMGSPSDFDNGIDDDEAFADEEVRGTRRLFRDKDRQVLGGVCAGLAAYFNTNIAWMRLGFVVFALLFGSTFFLYIILWAIIPSAKTRLEKLQMRGEKINLENLKKSAERDFDHIKKNVDEKLGQSQGFLGQLGGFIANILKLLIEFIRRCLGLLVPVLGGLFLVISVGGLIGCFVGLATLMTLFFSADGMIYPFEVFGTANMPMAMTTGVTLVVIPLIALLMLGLQLVFSIKVFNRYVFLGLLVVWSVALINGIRVGTAIGLDFKEEGEIRMVDTYEEPLDSYYLDLNKDLGPGASFSLRHDNGTINIGDFDDRPNRARVRISKSGDDQMYVVKKYSSAGKTLEIALERADDITYNYTLNGNRITFDYLFMVPEGTPLRDQDAIIELQVPVGTELIVDYNMKQIFNYLYHYDCSENLNGLKVKRLIMTDEGLKCVNEADEEEDLDSEF